MKSYQAQGISIVVGFCLVIVIISAIIVATCAVIKVKSMQRASEFISSEVKDDLSKS